MESYLVTHSFSKVLRLGDIELTPTGQLKTGKEKSLYLSGTFSDTRGPDVDEAYQHSNLLECAFGQIMRKIQLSTSQLVFNVRIT